MKTKYNLKKNFEVSNITNYIDQNFRLENFTNENDANYNEIKNIYKNSKADAIHSYEFIKTYLNKNKKILEVGGGVHLLASYLNEEYDITSIEPSGFTSFTNNISDKLISENNLKVYKNKLENFRTEEKFDLIFSMNVLEHTDDIEIHLHTCINFLRDKNSILLIHCPNYTFPFEPHFYKWFIPFMPNFTPMT